MTPVRTRTRKSPFGGGYSSYAISAFNPTTGYQSVPLRGSDKQPVFMGKQTTVSENHPWPAPAGSGDVGGDFLTERTIGIKPYSMHSGNIEGNYNNYPASRKRFEYHFALSCPIEYSAIDVPKWPTSPGSSDSSLLAKGTTAISRCRPTSSAAELSVALGELHKDGLPHLVGHQTWQSRAATAKAAGSEFLNVEFGWLPLVADITNFVTAVRDSAKILKQYEADYGKVIRRRYSFPDEISTHTETLGLNTNPEGINADTGFDVDVPNSHGGLWSKSTTTIVKRWFSGAFVYGIPPEVTSPGGIYELAAKADKLFGISLTPDVLWNITPWSWAIDWFSNTGDILETLSDYLTQGLVMQYGYIMEHSMTRVTYSLNGAVIHGNPVNVPNASLTFERKRRLRANPFGFGVSWDGLSTIQLAILAALGISRR